jgi:CheY-like chemotaxis protein
MKILFADDDPIIRQLYQRHLERAGYEWIGVTNGCQALEAAAREHPQLAVLDIVMPELDGLSVILELKRTPSTKAMPVILITAEPSYYLCRREFTNAGAAAFLTKPF